MSSSTAPSPPPPSLSSIPLPPGSPRRGIPGLPLPPGVTGGLRGGAPVPGYQPDGFAVRQWRPEAEATRETGTDGGWTPAVSSGGGGGWGSEQWPSLQQVAGRGRTPAVAPGSASQLTLREAVRFSDAGDWWTAPPPPPPPPEAPGRPSQPRETTLDEVVRPRPQMDWWEGGPTRTTGRDRTAEVTLGDVESSSTTAVPVSGRRASVQSDC